MRELFVAYCVLEQAKKALASEWGFGRYLSSWHCNVLYGADLHCAA